MDKQLDLLNRINLNIHRPRLPHAQKIKTRSLDAIEMIVLHHSASVGQTVEDINRVHIDRGFACAGYHFYITPDGDVYQCRTLKSVGAHCKDNNVFSIGICLAGDFTKSKPTRLQLGSCLKLIGYIYGELERDVPVKLHRDLRRTLCPGRDLIADLLMINLEHILRFDKPKEVTK